MRSITFFFLLCSSLLSFSQKGVSTKEFPYQVLFVEDATVFGKEVKQFDYLTNNDLLTVNGSITIFRYDYKMFELPKGRYWIDELVNERPEKDNYRPVLNPKGQYLNAISPKGHATCPSFNRIELVVPSEDILDAYEDEVIEIGWVLTKEEDYNLYKSFIVDFVNLYDNVVRSVEVNDYSISFRSDTLDNNRTDTINLSHGLLIVSIKAKYNHEFSTGNHGIRLYERSEDILNDNIDMKFTGLRQAIYYDYINDSLRANFLYREQVRKSNQDPRFIQLYEDFLERNSQFKAEKE